MSYKPKIHFQASRERTSCGYQIAKVTWTLHNWRLMTTKIKENVTCLKCLETSTSGRDGK